MSQATALASAQQRRGFWLRTLHQWHWISSAICLIVMVLFAATGITLNHAASIETKPVVVHRTATVPPALLKALGRRQDGHAPLPRVVADWLDAELDLNLAGHDGEWSTDEVYISLPRPGGDGWLSLDRANGQVEYESTDRGWISLLNDLHKGRNAGAAWSWFIDVFAVACLVFCMTGLLQFKLLLDGKPAPNTDVSVIRGSTRYRNGQDEIPVKTDAQGAFTITLPQASERRLNYVATLEGLPQ